MAVVSPSAAINRILAALGLENVRSLKISAEVNSAVAVVTEQYVTGTQMDDLAIALETKEWMLVPKDTGRWIPVSERLPPAPEGEWEDSVAVLAWRKGHGIDTACFIRDKDYGDRWGWECVGDPTHWMPLPAPPTE